MRILLLDGSTENDTALKTTLEVIKKTLNYSNYDVKLFTLRDIKIDHCLGCLDCWYKTPGLCVISDAGKEIVRAADESDLWISLTPITYGGYSWHLKKLLDRLIVILFPLFIKIDGDIHLRRRNNKKSKVIVFGSMAAENKELEDVFKKLVSHNSINFHGKCIVKTVLGSNCTEDVIKGMVDDALMRAGVHK
ncbi:MAG: NAD(P)H-dependent oxidoreductase [Candidatus Omnitrophota bacterium]